MDAKIARAKAIVQQEADAVRQVGERINNDFAKVVDQIVALPGRVVTSGMGKAGLIAQKISATFASTGTQSIYLHPAEAIHGDLGRLSAGDLLLALSKSGETSELLRLMAPVKAQGVPVVAITESHNSSLAKHSDTVLELGSIQEAGEMALAPSASTAAMLALGDALALVVQENKEFGPEDFARFHPGGNLGRRLMKVEELMRSGARNPRVETETTVLETLAIMTSTPGRPGAASITDREGLLLGFFTDGDLRRLLEAESRRDLRMPIDEVMTRNPLTIPPDTYATEALGMLHNKRVDQMPVVDDRGVLVGLLDVQDLLDLELG